jgi:hypothetical protein
MNTPPKIDLEPEAFRPVHDKPLEHPRTLKRALLICIAGTVLAAFAAWQLGGFWAALLPAGPAMLVGVAWAGLEPGWWFRNPPRT